MTSMSTSTVLSARIVPLLNTPEMMVRYTSWRTSSVQREGLDGEEGGKEERKREKE